MTASAPSREEALLPGEGVERLVRVVMVRRECSICGEPAVFRHAFLLENFRSNPRSEAYGRDDCTWCSDLDIFTCRVCSPTPPDGYHHGAARFEAVPRFAHMFLVEHRIEVAALSRAEEDSTTTAIAKACVSR